MTWLGLYVTPEQTWQSHREARSSRQHRLQVSEALGDLVFQFFDVGDDLRGRCSTSSWTISFVAVQRQVVALGDDVGLQHAEGRLGARPVPLGGGPVAPAGQHIGQVVGLDGVALVVEGVAVGLYVVEPDLVGAPELVLVNSRMAVDTPA